MKKVITSIVAMVLFASPMMAAACAVCLTPRCAVQSEGVETETAVEQADSSDEAHEGHCERVTQAAEVDPASLVQASGESVGTNPATRVTLMRVEATLSCCDALTSPNTPPTALRGRWQAVLAQPELQAGPATETLSQLSLSHRLLQVVTSTSEGLARGDRAPLKFGPPLFQQHKSLLL